MDKGPLSAHEIERREKDARHQSCVEWKGHYEQKGIHRTGEQIEREVASMQERIRRQRDHEIYRNR